MWQFISGGGEDGETPAMAAAREADEEAGLSAHLEWMKLDSIASIPRSALPGGAHWPPELYVVPEHCFAVCVTNQQLRLSEEHCRLEWLNLKQASELLTWDSNRVALWELAQRLQQAGLSKNGN
jgi:dATP pyrophosphohydrolase